MQFNIFEFQALKPGGFNRVARGKITEHHTDASYTATTSYPVLANTGARLQRHTTGARQDFVAQSQVKWPVRSAHSWKVSLRLTAIKVTAR
jgi:hypothetical protein